MPLYLPEIERKPKSVFEDRFFHRSGIFTPEQAGEFDRIVRLIVTGGNLDRYYRRSTQTDLLLMNRGILHLHIGGSGSDCLIYLVQYPAAVLLLCVGTHRHFDPPIGSRIPILGQEMFERRLQAETEQRNAERRRQIAASVALTLLRDPRRPK